MDLFLFWISKIWQLKQKERLSTLENYTQREGAISKCIHDHL